MRRGLVPRTPTMACSCEDGESVLAVCLGFSPSAAWSLSGAIRAEPGETWDLWQVSLADDDEVHVLPEYGRWLKEIRVANRIPKRRVWWVGERVVTR